jgi:hypothetical protein
MMTSVRCLLSFWLLTCLPNPSLALSDPSADLHVALWGLDQPSRGSVTTPFRTIQYAIDRAAPGQTVIVFEGHYSGPGNTKLVFTGRPIVLRSRAPFDPKCLRATILDAGGEGVIARFGPQTTSSTVVTGFTLLPGDPSNGTRGVRGFFEFAAGAAPKLDRLRIGRAEASSPLPEPASDFLPATSQTPFGPLLWDGRDPFHQPVRTLRYYGSGDLDRDSQLTSIDVAVLDQMAGSVLGPSQEADVNGDGRVDVTDVELLQSTLATGNLPAAWNKLTSRAAREAWVSKALDLDPTDHHTAYSYWNQCGGFSAQMFINFSYYRGDLHTTYYAGGPTVFNIPMYMVVVVSQTFGHAINAVLVGDNPLRFDDWLFIEPQNDQIVRPGMWNMPFNTNVQLMVAEELKQGGFNSVKKVEFHVSETGQTLVWHAPDLVLDRGDQIPPAREDRPDYWNPVLIPGSTGTTLVGSTRRDFPTGNRSDLYISSLDAPEQLGGGPLLGGDYSRLLDVARDRQGVVHLLWAGKEDSLPGVFYGRLHLSSRSITDKVRLSDGTRSVRMGRILATSDDSLHVFWLELMNNFFHPYPTGIYWTSNTGTGWRPAENLTPLPFLSLFDISNWWDRPDVMRYHFDVQELGFGGLSLVWNEPKGEPNTAESEEFAIKARTFNGTWGPPTLVTGAGGSAGVALARDERHRLHLVYSNGTERIENRGKLFHRISDDGRDWGPPLRLDSNGQACCPRMAAGSGGDVFVTWMEREGKQEQGAWRRYDGSRWQPVRKLNGRGREVWHPVISRLADGSMAAVWSSRSKDAIGVGSELLTFSVEPPGGAWLETSAVPGFRVKVLISSGNETISGTKINPCIAETLCVAGTLPDRAEVFLRVVGPRPNGKLWPTIVKFSASRVQVWIEQNATGELRYYDLAAVAPGDRLLTLDGLADTRGFDAAARSQVEVEPAVPGGGTAAPLEAATEPAPPEGTWLETSALPGFRVKVRIASAIAGQQVASCIAETLCVSGALPDRAEVFVRVVGPRPNGKLWSTLVKFSTSQVEVWIQQTASGATRYYNLEQVRPGERIVPLAGLADKEGFNP